MVERIQDLNLPNTNITKIIKDSLPPDVHMDKEARTAIARATSVFIMYLSSNAATNAHKHNHKTFSADDVFESIDEMDFKSFVAPMKSSLISFRKTVLDKKVKKQVDEKARQSTDRNSVGLSTSTGQTSSARPSLTLCEDVIEIDDSD